MAAAATTSSVSVSFEDSSAAKRVLALQQVADELGSNHLAAIEPDSEIASKVMASLFDGPAVAAAALSLPGMAQYFYWKPFRSVHFNAWRRNSASVEITS